MMSVEKVIDKFSSDSIHVFCKDEAGYYIDASPKLIELAEVPSKQHFIGALDQDTSWRQFAEKYKLDDQLVFKSNKPTVITELFYSRLTDMQTALTVKIPIVEGGRKLLLGILMFANASCQVEFFNAIIEVSKDISPKLAALVRANLQFHAADDGFDCLALREKQCLHYYVIGYTAKEIAKILEVGYRTVEQYIANAKDKLNCHSKFELINKILSTPESIN